jgi:hypothetical protein
MANRNQPNAQNSELDPKKHPSGARIEKMMNEGENPIDMNGDKGLYGETLRPSEREDSYRSTSDDTHRRTPSTREQ